MKRIHFWVRLLSLFLLLALMGSSCKKEEVSPLDQLPAATQEGRNTFGCLVNGKVHVPTGSGGFGVPPYDCFYMYIPPGNGEPGGYTFFVSATDTKATVWTMVSLGTYNLPLTEGMKYNLKTPFIDGEAYGELNYAPIGLNVYAISPPLIGEMRITKFDEQRRIVAGTFWFDAVNAAGARVEVREGRFDMKF